MAAARVYRRLSLTLEKAGGFISGPCQLTSRVGARFTVFLDTPTRLAVSACVNPLSESAGWGATEPPWLGPSL
jgi:hypothetical protein